MNPIFYKRFVDNIYSKRKSQQDVLFEALNNLHPNIKLTIEVNLVKFLDTTVILNNEGVVTTQIYRKKIRKLYLGCLKFQKHISETSFQRICRDLEK